MAFNSYVLIKRGMAAPDRAKLLGHSVETNLRNYTYPLSDDHIDSLKKIIDGDIKENAGEPAFSVSSTSQYPTVIPFTERKRTPKNREFKGIL